MGGSGLDVGQMLARIAEAVRPFPKAAMFALADEGYRAPFEQLVACMLSIRTLDEVTLPAARALIAVARTPAAFASMSPDTIEAAIPATSLRSTKARQIHAIARTLVEEHGGGLPCERAVLLALPGVGPKCANLVLGIACGHPHVSVDAHVHRVTNRWGYVATRTPEETMHVLEAKVPVPLRVDVNRFLVPFGKHICVRSGPFCSRCPVLGSCRQVGVTRPR